MRDFISHLEHEERIFRALGGLTALGNLQKVCFVVPVVCVVVWRVNSLFSCNDRRLTTISTPW